MAQEINGKAFTVKIKAGSQGRVFGSVTGANIADALQTAGYNVDKKRVVLTLGEYDIELKLLEGITAKIKISVEAE